jgi:hypothetical protein
VNAADTQSPSRYPPGPPKFIAFCVATPVANVATTNGCLHARPNTSSGLRLDEGIFW